jgi:peptide/nickel transport system substrate-binding protein
VVFAAADAARNIAPTRDPAVLLIGQLREIYIDGELEMVDSEERHYRCFHFDVDKLLARSSLTVKVMALSR